ncbi:AraC family transcriptional regulator [Nocardioides sp. JQ2195]|uniref:AraC family transcriptional regulator n=1 Tax=Nocardioides sp. JQ2195 TaxID=2592334 RepID=UPI00143E13D6|nr:AraC family transcriptional regulator [Nocardioides sp. JQ2195]QIX28903.1 AraC family transcriptional regulator [Nocardioides sp. JQ2195]
MIRAASLRGFAPLVTELGGNVDALLERFGIRREVLLDEDGLISITAHDRMLDAAADELECCDLGLRLAEGQDLGILGQLAVAIEASPTAVDALECASRFMFVHSPALSISLGADPWGDPDVVALTYRKDLRESPYSPQAMELGIGVFHRVATNLIGNAAGLRTVELPHQPISPVSRYLDFFAADVKFGRPAAALRVEARALDEHFASANDSIRRIAMDHLAAQYADPSRLVSAQVRGALAGSLHTTAPAIANVARLLAIHPRTLQRQLAAEGTTFEQVLDDVRRSAARRFITTTELPLGQVSAMVGFAEQSALSHAVRRWFGMSPRELRRAEPVVGA